MDGLHAAPVHARQASSQPEPFDILANAIELARWETTLRPTDKLHGPSFWFTQSDRGMWRAEHHAPLGGDLVWACEGENPHTVMAIFREHLRSLVSN